MRARIAWALAVAAAIGLALWGLPGRTPVEPAMPGVDARVLPDALARQLALAPVADLARVTHRRADGSPRFTNRLSRSSSPYLLQHAHNPVNWFPWGDEAFALANQLDRPIFLSIGYATCHWCHVMEEESFEDLEVAELLNRHFIAIKVDREARPDVDRLYMEAVKALHGSGGWPATVWLTPDRRPFFAATYVPARDGDRGIRTGLLTFLREIASTWDGSRAEVDGTAARLSALVRERLSAPPEAGPLPEDPSAGLAAWVRAEFDPEHGGRRGRMKFPSGLPVRAMVASPDAELREMADRTLLAMASGGVYDQVAGGYHRYAVDPAWRVPHFEKTLVDNALLARVHAEAFQRGGDLRHAAIVDEILMFLARDLGLRGGGFASASDADSGPDRVEGAHVTWTADELVLALGPERGAAVAAAWGIAGEGPVDGRHVPAWTVVPTHAQRQALQRDRLDLLFARRARPAPDRDDKLIVGWNGLAIAAFAQSGWLFSRPDWLDEARQAAEVVLDAREAEVLPRFLGPKGPEGEGFLDDHAYLADGLITLFEATGEVRWLDEALRTVADAKARFGADGPWYATPDGHDPLLVRERPIVDQSAPGPNAVLVGVLLRLASITGDDAHRADAVSIASGLALDRQPAAAAEAVLALAGRPLREIVLVVPAGGRAPSGLLAAIRTAPPSTRVLVQLTEGDRELEARAPPAAGKLALDGQPTVYVCQGGVCDAPTRDPAELAAKLAR